MKRIFYFTGHRLSVLHWDAKAFSGTCTFEPDARGFEKFERYLQSAAKIRTKLLVDVIEEDFRLETIPHVYGKDRKAVISRLNDRYFRASRQFTYSEIIGREKTGRKDNKVLLGAITNPSLIQPWLDIIEQCDVPLSGIWTLPLTSKFLLPVINARTGPVLLVSQQVNSNLRQTFFRDGKMISSRQSVINQDATDISKIGEFAKPEVDRTVKFLRSQQLISSDEVVQVHIIAADEQRESLEKNFVATEDEQITIHDIKDVEKSIGCNGYDSKFCDGLYAWLCLKQLDAGSHYGSEKERERYVFSLASTAIYAASIILLVLALLITEANVSDAIEYKKSTELLQTQEAGFRKTYKNKFEAYEDVFANAAAMNTAVDLADRIRRHGAVSPLDLYLEVGKAIEDARISGITIDTIEWRSEQIRMKNGKPEVVARPNIISGDEVRHNAVISGRIAISNHDYSASVDKIQEVIDTLGEHERVVSVEAIDMPVEIRSDKKFAAESGVSQDSKQESEGSFSLRIIMSGVDDG